MFESLLSAGGVNSGATSDLGPGPKIVLAGNTTNGYFGEMKQSELFSSEQMSAMGGFTEGNILTVPDSVPMWLKFAINGKILYVAKVQMRSLISWNAIYNAGLLYGTKDRGKYPIGVGVEQFKVVRKYENGQPWYLFPRLLTGFDADPTMTPVTSTQMDGGEYSLTLGRVVPGANGAITEKWANFTVGQISSGAQVGCWTQETSVLNVVNAVQRGLSANLTTGSIYPKDYVATNIASWRPVLELIPKAAVKDPFQVTDLGVGTLTPAIYAANPLIDPVKNPQNVRAPWPTKQPVIANLTLTDTPKNPVNLIGDTEVSLNPFSLTGAPANLVYDPNNLVYNIAPLNAFTVSGINLA